MPESDFFDKIAKTNKDIERFILNTSTFERKDRLWPSHFSVFETNPLSISYGACGISIFLNEHKSDVSLRIKNWMASQEINTHHYPPGLYMGLAGIAYTFLKLGMISKSEEVMQIAYASDLLYEEPNMYLGVAGWGLASLYLFQKTEKNLYRNKAIQGGEFLRETAIKKDSGITWTYNEDNRIRFGYGYGSSGIALFLLHLGIITDRVDFLDTAKEALEFSLSQSRQDETGIGWGRFANDVLTEPYLLHGSSGIGSVAIRFYNVFNEEKYLRVCEDIAQSVFLRFAMLPTLLIGLSGIGEFMLDMHQYTSKSEYLHKAKQLAESALWFKIEREEGITFPGRWWTRISTDFATGSAGVGLFFDRLIHNKNRLLFDL